MMTNFDMSQNAGKFVYVRAVPVANLPEKLRAQAGDAATIYSMNAEDGEQIALVISRELAFSIAREHDLSPVMVQ
jgi:hypothetical protein